jgi:hypothetical protein
MFKGRRRLIAAAATVIIAVLGLAASGGSPARAATATRAAVTSYTYDVMDYNANGEYCMTADGGVAWDSIVLGVCADAATQLLIPVVIAPGEWELKFDSDGLCVTYPNAEDKPNGSLAVQGVCNDATTQTFSLDSNTNGGITWYDPDITNEDGQIIAIDDQNGVQKAYNPIDGSYMKVNSEGYDNSVTSEYWVGPDCYTTDDFGDCLA